ncbi:1-acylglycerol-3-phosphate O-acyltransferase [Psittacicella hinzii]|uniref:1-acyl-sn-glycerol-3-phosphate acyltransferase n=1 Tax=Psittacicella hinzii TaxID=2028575 RepID=A0A3A1YVT4_9GAMM|nr:1-acylglycerol-3-phosphate O-acyltransferase [Psittacicella hinzii]RIY40177.1 hypothetical protein CKF58_00925 [Psittacicella hinzii]
MYYLIAFIRTLVVLIYWILLCIIAFICCLPRLKDKRNMYAIATYVRCLLKPVYGLNTYIEKEVDELPKTAVYISNHQNTLDIVTLAKMIQPNTVTVGKRQLSWIPIFGWMYWAAGNILIEKTSASKSYKTIQQVVDKIVNHQYCVWLFPEGTRSYGRWEIGSFKAGAFLTAIEAGVPIVPIVVSDLNKYRIGKLDNGEVIMKYLKPINTKGMTRAQAKALAAELEELFLTEYRKLNEKVSKKDFADCQDMVKFSFVDNAEWMEKNPAYEFKASKDTANTQSSAVENTELAQDLVEANDLVKDQVNTQTAEQVQDKADS